MKKKEAEPATASKAKKRGRKLPLLQITSLLSVATLVLTATFARYVSKTQQSGGATISPFAVSLEVDAESLLEFRNASYILNGTTMNEPQSTLFHVKNSKTENGETKVSTTDYRYSLTFYLPAIFAQTVALQLAKVEGDTQTAVTPLYIVNDLVGASAFTTNSARYAALPAAEESYRYQSGLFTDVANEGNTLLVEKNVERTASVQYSFPTRDRSTNETLPALHLAIEETVRYCKITFTRESFYLAAAKDGSPVSHDYALRVIPTKAIAQGNFGEQTVVEDPDFSKDWTTCLASTYSPSGAAWVTQESVFTKMGNWTATLHDDGKIDLTEKDASGNATHEDVLVGAQPAGLPEHGTNIGKSYSCRINAVFEQASTAS